MDIFAHALWTAGATVALRRRLRRPLSLAGRFYGASFPIFLALPSRRWSESGGISAARPHPCCPILMAASIYALYGLFTMQATACSSCLGVRNRMASRKTSAIRDAGMESAYSDRHSHPSRDFRAALSLAAVVLSDLWASLGKPLVLSCRLHGPVPALFVDLDWGQETALIGGFWVKLGSFNRSVLALVECNRDFATVDL
jgi:hypothetical protein